MSESSRRRRFFHTGSALAVGGYLVDPNPDQIVSRGSSLPPPGGYDSHRVESFKFKEIVSFESASGEVIGRYDEKTGVHSTLCTSIVKGLNVLGVVTADAVVARLAASYKEHGGNGGAPAKEAQNPSPFKFSIIGSHFVNLRIGGKLIDAKLMSEAADSTNVEALTFKLLHQNPIRQALFLSDQKHGQHIPGFGRVYIGEFYPDPRTPRLAMLRFELGCAVTGEMACAVVEGGGDEWP